MRVFVTGATGFIGSAVVRELLDAGHQVLGLARSDAGVQSLAAAGAQVHRGDLTDLASLRSGADSADAVIHTAFIHDWSRFKESCDVDRRAIETLGSVLAGTERPLVVSGGLARLDSDAPITEDNPAPPVLESFPRASEQTADSLAQRGVRTAVVRLPQVHNTAKQGLVTLLIALAREKGCSAYIGDGTNRWAAAHVLDVARLYRLVVEKGQPGGRYIAVAEEGVPTRDIAAAIGRGLELPLVSLTPDKAPAHFGFLAAFAGRNLTASSVLTQQRLGWHPTGPGLIADLENMNSIAG